MNEQATLEGQTATTCTGCGSPRPDGYRVHERCDACRKLAGEERRECDACEGEHFASDMYEEAFYFSPFDDEEKLSGFAYCLECIDQGADDPDGQVFYCDWCERSIASDNGRMQHYRLLNDCEQVCLRCIETTLKDSGIAGIDGDQTLDEVFAGKMFGMFFNVGELEAEGWTPDADYHDARIDGLEGARALGKRAEEHHLAGRRIIIGYERLSIIGDEGYVTLFTKEAKA